MTLEEKLATIDKPKMPKMQSGKAGTIKDFWNTFVEPKLIPVEVTQKWCGLLYRYIDDANVIYAIRKFSDRGKNGDEDLRRGFYTQTNMDYGFFYTDNYFSAYFFKMAFDGFVPNYEEFKNSFVLRNFPARFGQCCQTERDKAAFRITAKDPKINSAGYKISHIVDVGTNYFDGSKILSISDICNKYFPRGTYDDWKETENEHGKFYVRELNIEDNMAKEYLKAIFLRMACPLNYILTPKKSLQQTEIPVEKNDIGESKKLQEYAIKVFKEKYGTVYDNFLNKIMKIPETELLNDVEDYKINLKYGFNVSQKIEKPVRDAAIIKKMPLANGIQNDLQLRLAEEYLFNPNTSFRKLEKEIMIIDSPVRGGGFKAKKIINDLGITADKKGILASVKIEDEIAKASGNYKTILIKIRTAIG